MVITSRPSKLVGNIFKHVNTITNYYEKKFESRLSKIRQNIISTIEKYVANNLTALAVSKEFSMVDKIDLLVSADFNSLYPSAMEHTDSEKRNKETPKPKNQQVSKRLCSSFNKKSWRARSKSIFFKVKYYNAKEIIFQHVSVK